MLNYLEYLNIHSFNKYILTSKFSEPDYKIVILLLVGVEDKFIVFHSLNIKPGDSIEKNVDFGNTYM
jgi:hypothetical protein